MKYLKLYEKFDDEFEEVWEEEDENEIKVGDYVISTINNRFNITKNLSILSVNKVFDNNIIRVFDNIEDTHFEVETTGGSEWFNKEIYGGPFFFKKIYQISDNYLNIGDIFFPLDYDFGDDINNRFLARKLSDDLAILFTFDRNLRNNRKIVLRISYYNGEIFLPDDETTEMIKKFAKKYGYYEIYKTL